MEEKGKSSLTHLLYLKKNNQSNSEHNQTRNISCLIAVQMFVSRTFALFMEHGYTAMALLNDDGNGVLERYLLQVKGKVNGEKGIFEYLFKCRGSKRRLS
jgi:hypothetical protein